MILRLLCAALLAASPVVGQVVHLANHGSRPWAGWSRFNVDVEPPADAGWRLSSNPPMQAGTPITAGGRSGQIEVQYVKGSRAGLDTWHIDLWCSLAPGQQLDLDLATLDAHDRPVPQLPADLGGWFAGLPAINGVPMGLVAIAIDGAAWTSHWRVRTGRMLVVDFWCTWYPNVPYVLGEALVTCSNPNVPDMTETVATDVRLEFGDAVVLAMNQAQPGLLVAAGTKFGDGQARAVPITAIWLRNLDPKKWGAQLDSFMCDQGRAIGGVGVDRLSMDGRPRLPPGFSSAAWVNANWGETIARIHDWRVGTTGPNAKSGDTGAQTGDQVFVGAEALGTPGAEVVRYLGALKLAARPCYHREADGSPLDPARHTAKPLIFWDGRPAAPLWGMCEHLGKPRGLDFDAGETSGWWGPDVEHQFANTLFAAVRVTGSPCLQELARAWATNYMLQQTTVAGWSTSSAFASRAIGWEGILAVHCWRELEDRAQADRVRAHWLARWATVLRPELTGRTFWRDGFTDQGKMSLWQQAVGAYGLDLAGRAFGSQEAQDVALAAARAVLQFGYVQNTTTGVWSTYSTNLLPSGAPDPIATGIFTGFGFPMAPWVVLRREPENAQALAIWQQAVAGATQLHQAQWLPPGVQ